MFAKPKSKSSEEFFELTGRKEGKKTIRRQYSILFHNRSVGTKIEFFSLKANIQISTKLFWRVKYVGIVSFPASCTTPQQSIPFNLKWHLTKLRGLFQGQKNVPTLCNV